MKTLQNVRNTSAAFLDIERAFNNVTSETILEYLAKLEVSKSLVQWIENIISGHH